MEKKDLYYSTTSNNNSSNENKQLATEYSNLLKNITELLGSDDHVTQWIESKEDSLIHINLLDATKEQLIMDKSKLHDIIIEINDKVFTILNYILCKIPGYGRLNIFNQHVKAKIRRINRQILSFDETNTKEFITQQTPQRFFESSDNAYLNYLKQSLEKNNFINNSYNDDGPHSFEYDDNIMEEQTDFASIQNNNNFNVNTPIMEQCENSIKSNYKDSNIHEIDAQDREIATSIAGVVSFNQENIDDFNSNNYCMKKNCERDDVIENVNPKACASFVWNDSEDEYADITKFTKEIDINDKNLTLQLIDDVQNDSIGNKFNNLDFPHCQEMLHVFRMKFGLHQFRPNQLSAINAVILGYDCFILMPTGGGKSLCYQLPALLSPGITIVISPLRSLIIDQIQKLSSLDIPAMYLTADLSDTQVYRVFRKLHETTPDLKLLYVTPEKLSMSAKFCRSLESLYQRGKLTRFIIDEVHCVSQWGHDFRPDYKKLSILKIKFPDVPVIVLTATATRRVRSDVLHQLQIFSPMWFISSFNRPNLRYSVIPKKTRAACQQIVDIIKSKFPNECGIIYCISRKDCDDQANLLHSKGIVALSYHAGLEDKVRIDRQSQWISEKVKVICATIAFGMGIDKPNVRFVIHSSIPKSIEGYYQESGRAGRDGDVADCFLLYNYADMHRYRNIMERNNYANAEALKTHLDNLYKIVHFCENLTDCRRALQLNYFGEKFDRQECISNSDTTCDNCRTYDKFVSIDVTDDAKALVKLIQALNTVRTYNVTILQVVDIYKGCNVSNISYKLGYNYHEWFGRGKSMTKCEIERLLHNLVIEGYLHENMELNNGIICAYVAPGELANKLLYDDEIQIFMHKKRVVQKVTSEHSKLQISAVANAELKDLEQRCYMELFDIVNGIAGALDVSANSIMNIVALRAMSQQLPSDEQAMLKIPHVTKANFLKYGKALLDVTQKYSKEKEEYLKREEQEQLEFMDFESYDSEYEYGCKDDTKEIQSNSNKRSKNKTVNESKKFKSNNNYHNTSGTTTSLARSKKNAKGDSTCKSANISKYFTSVKESNSLKSIKGNKSCNTTTTKNGHGTSIRSMYNNNGPGLCEFTKKLPIINS